MKQALLCVCVGIAALSASTAATAADGTITFQGQVVDSTCTIHANDTNKSVVMPRVGKGEFTRVGDTVAKKRFTITLTQCPTGTNARVFFNADAGNIDYTQNALKNIATTGAGAGVGFALFEESSSTPIRLGQAQAGALHAAAGTDVVMPYEVSYIQYGATVSPGAVTGMVTYTIDYQ